MTDSQKVEAGNIFSWLLEKAEINQSGLAQTLFDKGFCLVQDKPATFDSLKKTVSNYVKGSFMAPNAAFIRAVGEALNEEKLFDLYFAKDEKEMGKIISQIKNAENPDNKAQKAAEEAIKKIQEMRVKKDPNEILQEAFTSTEVACLYILGVSHQNSLMERRNIEALMQTVDERVRLILLEALAVRRIYLEVTHPKQTSLSVQS